MLTKKVKEVLTSLQKSGVLEQCMLIGSWCNYFYQFYFKDINYKPVIQTLDIDFLIPDVKKKTVKPISVEQLLKDLDFETDFGGSGWVRYIHPELRVEFLAPRLGLQPDTPKFVAFFKINAMPLRHTATLTEHAIEVEGDGIKVKLPHPAAFSLHKLFISERRKESGKKIRDFESAMRVLESLKSLNKYNEINKVWLTMTKKEQRGVLLALKNNRTTHEVEWLVNLLKN